MAPSKPSSPARSDAVSGDLVGREDEVKEVAELVDGRRRVVLYGPPGVGTSRLARAVVARVGGEGPARFLTVPARFELEQLLTYLADELDVEIAEGAALDEWCELITGTAFDRGTDLIVVDGLEGPEVVSRFVRLWRATEVAPNLLVTSRSAAERGAAVYRLGGLDSAAGAELILRAAGRHGVSLEPDAEQRQGLERLSRRLDGLPAALEAIAPRLSVMQPRQLLERASDRFELFDVDARGVDFEASLEEAFERLSPTERACLAQCAAFRESFSLTAAEYVVEWSEATDERVMDVLGRLVRSSWLEKHRPETGEVRFGWLETLRAFVKSRSEHDGARRAARGRHAEYYGRLAQQIREQGWTAAGTDVASRLERAAPELVAAVERYLDRDPGFAVDVLRAFRWPTEQGQVDAGEVEELVERALEVAEEGEATREWTVELASWATALAVRRGDGDRALEFAGRAQSAANELGLPAELVEAKHAASLASTRVDPQLAEERLGEALDALESGSVERDWLWEGRIRERLGFLALKDSDLTGAEREFGRARSLMAGRAHPLLTTGIHSGLGWVQFRRGTAESAVAALRRTVEIYREHGTPDREAVARFNLGACLHARGDLGAAEEEWERARESWASSGSDAYDHLLAARTGMVALERGSFQSARGELERAVNASYDRGEDHHRAIAEAYLEALSMADGAGGTNAYVYQTLSRSITSHVDPDAAAAVHAFRALASAELGDREGVRESLQKIGGVGDLVEPEDRYYRASVWGIGRIASLAAAEILPELEGELSDQHLGEEPPLAFAAADDLDALSTREAGQLPNHHLRLVLALGSRMAGLDEPARTDRSDETAEVVVHRYGNWFRVRGEEPVDLRNRGPLRRILRRLVQCDRSDEERGCEVGELIEAGWPDEVLTESSGSNRVYTSIRMLRDLGLEGYLATGEEGYHFEVPRGLAVVETAFDEVGP